MLRKLDTIQTKENLNEVYANPIKGPGNGNHCYTIVCGDKEVDIMFQNGPRKDPNSTHGVIDSDLLEIVRDRLKGFQSGEYASEYNAKALEHIEEALKWMNKRVEDRISRGVLGTMNK